MNRTARAVLIVGLLTGGCGGGDTTTIVQQAPPATATETGTTPTPTEARYQGLVSCSLYTDDADEVCFGGDQPGAIFKALDQDQVAYEMCVRPPSGSEGCIPATTPLAGQPSRLPIDAGELGLFRVTWKVQGSAVAQASFTLEVESEAGP